MASQCKRQQCTIDRRGFRQELDSWRHKLVHCVGFESILEGLFGPELVEDLTLFKDFEPTTVSDWSFDENCVFCCLRRDKVKEHLIGLNNEGLEDTPKPLLVKDLSTINKLEKQAEEFLHAVLSRKDVPNFSDPHIPVVAREILQRMIRQFAAEYTSKSSSPQDSGSDSKPGPDQSLLSGAPPSTSPAATLAGPAHNQNPVLSKLLMADQDAPLDLTIKRPLAVPSEQDGVLDLSIKKNRYSSSSLPVRSPCLSPATSMLKGESQDFPIAKAKDLQSTSTLEQFMAKLCPHHQRQIVDAIGFLQTEVKALASSSTQQASKSISGIQGTVCSTPKSTVLTSEKSSPELKFPSESSPKSEVQDMSHSGQSSCVMKKAPENAVSLKTSTGPALDLHGPGSGSNQTLVTPATDPLDAENSRNGDHAPLKMKIMTSNVAAGKKLSCVLSSHSDTVGERQGNSYSSIRTETQSARLSSIVKRHNHTHQGRHRETLGHAKEKSANLFSVHMTIPSDSPRTARKTARSSSDHRIRDSACRGMPDPDLGHCDIVFIDKPITECFKEQRRGMLPRRNARKSTRGHMYSDEIWELKTVRTLAGKGNCPNPMPELITLVTPKQVLSKPDGVPPVDMPFAGACREAMNKQMSTEESDESVIPGTGDTVEVAASEVDIPVETSQTDQCQSRGQSAPSSPIRSPTENIQTDMNTDGEQGTPEELVTNEDSGTTAAAGEEGAAQAKSEEAEKENKPESPEDKHESNDQILPETVEPSEDAATEEDETQLSSDTLCNSEPVLQDNSAPSPLAQTEVEMEENDRKEAQDEPMQELQPETQLHNDNFEVTEMSNTTEGLTEGMMVKEPDVKPPEADNGVKSLETEGDNDNDDDVDVSSKTLDALLKELPPWRRKKGTVLSLPKRLRKTEEVVVGFVNGRPISASDRSLRRRTASNSTVSPNKTPVKSSPNIPNKTSGDSNVEATVENKRVMKQLKLLEMDMVVKPIVTTPVKEPTFPLPSIPKSKFPSCTKQTRKQKAQKDPHVLSNQRQLRSATQRPAEAPVSPPKSSAVTSIPSPQPPPTHPLPSTEHLPSVLPTPMLPDTSPAISSPSPAVSEQSQLQAVSDTTVESNTENSQPVEGTAKTIQAENESPTRQKPRSTKATVDCNSEKPSWEVSCPLDTSVNTETQMQVMPLRSKRVLRKEAEASDVAVQQKPNVACLDGVSASGDDSSSSPSAKPVRMPLRSERSKADISHQPVNQSSPGDNKKLALRSQRSGVPSTSAPTVARRQSDVASPTRVNPERVTKAPGKPVPVSVGSALPHSSAGPGATQRPEPPKQTNKFFEMLTGEENQHLVSNLNIKYDKMQKGWVQMDKEGQPAAKYKNKADRQAAIWKSKRRARKSKSSDHQKYSPVQMLFMKGFNLTSICRWFLETTETKSLVIVKKVNTRLPSETQLCFHSSSSSSGTSQGVFPSLQAERLKKHLKKFAIASPVKSNPKSQKLIAKALEVEAHAVKGKERRELPSTTQTLTKSQSSAKACVPIAESQKSSGKSKNPASARILRKYSNIRGKMQVQQTNVRLQEASKTLKNNKQLPTKKSATKSNMKPSLKDKKPVGRQMKAAKMQRNNTLAGGKATKPPVQQRAIKPQSSSRAPRDVTKKGELPKRCSQRLGSPKISEHNPSEASKSKVDSKKQVEADKAEVEKPAANKVNAAKIQTKEPPQSTETKGGEGVDETPQQSADNKAPTSPDQVLTRSQRKMEVPVPLKRPTKSMKTQNASPKLTRKIEELSPTRRGALKSTAKRRHTAPLPRGETKSATKRAGELLDTPAKRTRTSLSK